MKNQVQLCTYVNRLGGGNIETLTSILNTELNDLFSGVHLLPFYYPIDGEDAGFDPIDHTKVDNRLGSWAEVNELSNSFEIVADLIVNHISADSPQFQDFLEKGSESAFAPLVLTYSSVFPNGASEEELLALYRPRPGFPFTKMSLRDGSTKMIWTTFTSKQIDIDVKSEAGNTYLNSVLDALHEGSVKMLRLDAAGYSIKKRGTSCFMTDDTFAFIGELTDRASKRDMEVLVEIHSHYKTQIEIAKRVDWVYDFALPPLVLHTLIKRDSAPIKAWYDISPRNAITVLDTHDGIGIIDIAPDEQGEGLLNAEQIDELVESIHELSNGESRMATGAAASNVDLYQVNCTYYSALGSDDNTYLLARLIHFFSPGIPQVYYAGLLCGENDMALLAKTRVGRDINRHYYQREEIVEQIERPVVKNLMSLIKLRNQHPAFDGEFSCLSCGTSELKLKWTGSAASIELSIDLLELTFEIVSKQGDFAKTATNFDQVSNL